MPPDLYMESDGGHTIKILALKDSYVWGSGGHPLKKFHRSWLKAFTKLIHDTAQKACQQIAKSENK